MTDAPVAAAPAAAPAAPVAEAPIVTATGSTLSPTPGVPVVERNLLGDTKPVDPAGAPEPATLEPAPAAPQLKAEDYKFKVPDGLDVNSPAVGALAAIAAEQGIKPEAAQAIMDKVSPEIVKALNEPYQAWKNLQEKWQTEVRNDPEIGGAKFDTEVLPTIAKAMDKYGDPGLREALAMTGAGNNPAIIRSLYTLSRMVTEGGPVIGQPTGTKVSPAERMYPTHAGGKAA